MTAKKMGVYLAPETLAFLDLLDGPHGDIELGLSSAVNLSVQFCALVADKTGLPFNAGELLFCCDCLNGGAQMTEFKDPDSVSIAAALESMVFGLLDSARSNYGQEVEKWGINPALFCDKLQNFELVELFTLAIATRQFWNGKAFGRFKNISDSGDYRVWAAQWLDGKAV